MRTTHTRLVAVTAATLALVAGASSAVSAQPGDDDPFAFGEGWSRRGDRIERRSPFRPGRAGWLGAIAGRFDGFVRQETTFEGEEGLVTRRVDNGTLLGATDSSVEYSIADGQTASASIDEDTEIIALEEEIVDLGRRGLMQRQLSAEPVAAADLAVDSDILVWAESQDGGTFVAQRIVVQPVDESEAETTDGSEAETSDDATASPAPAASPASA